MRDQQTRLERLQAALKSSLYSARSSGSALKQLDGCACVSAVPAKSPIREPSQVRGPGGGLSVKSAPASANRGPGGAGLEQPQDPHILSQAGSPRGRGPSRGPPRDLWLLGRVVGVGGVFAAPLCVRCKAPTPRSHPGPRSQIQTFLQAPSSWGPQPTIELQSVSPPGPFPPTSSHPGPPEALPPVPSVREVYACVFLDVLRAAKRTHSVSVHRSPMR